MAPLTFTSRRAGTALLVWMSTALFACHHAKSGTPTPSGSPCGQGFCHSGEVCLERPSAPGVPACVAHGDCNAKPPGRDLFGDALAAVGLDRCSAVLPEDFLGSRTPTSLTEDVFRLPHFDGLHHQPLQVPNWAQGLVDALPRPGASHAVSDAIAEAASRLGHPLQLTQYTHPVDASAPLATAVEDLIRHQNGTVDADAIGADAADVPLEIQQKVAMLVYAVSDATDARDQAFANVTSPDQLPNCITGMVLVGPGCSTFSPTDATDRAMLATRIQWDELYQAAYHLARAVEDSTLQVNLGAMGLSFDQDTPLGRIVLADAGSQTYAEKDPPIALLVDFGGDDTYRNSAGAAIDSHYAVALHVDLGGDDVYGYEEHPGPNDTGRLPSDVDGRLTPGDLTMGQTALSLSSHPRQGAGRFGIGLLFDFAGNDHYHSLRMSQGFGALGVGVLADLGGDDQYAAEAGAQGSALFGIGLLLDSSGNDTYRLYADGQGFGFTGGFGALVDGDGTDVYYANPGDPAEGGDPLYFTPQLPAKGNASFAQGAGFGRRPSDPAYAGSMSGGIGLLADFGNGDDSYTASVFGQGTGYWFGTGVLYDEGGNDQYDGKWYVRGSAAHFAIALFRDHAGNDVYGTGKVAPAATSYGVGHDFSIGWLIDDAGDDVYNAPGLSLGSGNACGWGFLVDVSGNDTYAPAGGPTLGAFGDPLDCSFNSGSTLGLFIDGGGTNSYSVGGMSIPRSGSTTLAIPNPKAPDAKGALVDGSGSVLILP